VGVQMSAEKRTNERAKDQRGLSVEGERNGTRTIQYPKTLRGSKERVKRLQSGRFYIATYDQTDQ
jgi:hypothetical protein